MGELDERRARLSAHLAAMRQLLLVDTLSESDVRAKLIDPLFVQALGWPESQIRRERNTSGRDYIDYELGRPRTLLIAEAKRATKEFSMPKQTHRRTFSVKSLIAGDTTLAEAITQVATYCQDEGVPHALVTNGLQIVLFRALRTDRPWRTGDAIVFRSPDELTGGFHELWDLLSYSAVRGGSLEAFFSFPDETPRHHRSVISTLANPDEKLVRNALNGELIPVMGAVFEDLTEETRAKALEHCYVYSAQLQSIADDFILTIKDLPPQYLRDQVQHLNVSRTGVPPVEEAIAKLAAQRRKGSVLLLLGGVGSGKTTFLRQMRVKYCRKTIDETGAYYYIDFRDAPRQPPFEGFVFAALREQLEHDPVLRELLHAEGIPQADQGATIAHPAVLAHLFRDELERADRFASVLGTTPGETAAEKLATVTRLAADDREVVRRALSLVAKGGRFILLALDNADQHDLPYQLSIFMFAQNVAAETGANIICALREEKYYLASQQGAFNAFHTQRFHIPSPRLTELLVQRLDFAQRHLDELLAGVEPGKVEDVRVLLDVIWRGGVGTHGRSGSSNVVRLLERICMGDMRRALKMFRRFMRSGNTDVRKILSIARNSPEKRVPYHIPFHEFTKSVMLDDRRHYREGDTEDEVLNLFAISGTAPNSHFTALRVLAYLMDASERRSAFGTGFVEWPEVLTQFEAIFPDCRDVRFHIERMLFRSLIESDTGVSAPSGESALDHCRAIRATPSGEYYLTFLVRAFAYVDLVWIDTPLSDSALVAQLRELVPSRDRVGRFERVDAFVKYLASEEARERQSFPALLRAGPWAGPFIPTIAAQLEKEKLVIARNFARYERP